MPALSAFPPRRDTPVPSPCLWPFPGLCPVASHLSRAGEPRAGIALQMWPHGAGERVESIRVPLAALPVTLAGHLGDSPLACIPPGPFWLSHCRFVGLFLPRCSVWNFLLLNCMWFLLALSSSHLNKIV